MVLIRLFAIKNGLHDKMHRFSSDIYQCCVSTLWQVIVFSRKEEEK